MQSAAQRRTKEGGGAIPNRVPRPPAVGSLAAVWLVVMQYKGEYFHTLVNGISVTLTAVKGLLCRDE